MTGAQGCDGANEPQAPLMTVNADNPTPATINFRMFMASGTQPEFWTASDDAAEIV